MKKHVPETLDTMEDAACIPEKHVCAAYIHEKPCHAMVKQVT